MVDAVVEVTAAGRKVSAVHCVGGLKYQRYRQTDEDVSKHECQRDQEKRFSQQQHRQNNHVGKVEPFACKEDGVFSRRMFGAFQISVGGKEEALKVSQENIIEGKESVNEQRVDVLEPVPGCARFVWRKAKDAASGKRVIFPMQIDAGVVPSMMQDAPHVRIDSTDIENIIQSFVYRPERRNRIVVAVVRNVQHQECLGQATRR